MYEDFRLNLMRELLSEGLDDVTMARVMGVVDRIGACYDVSAKETALVPVGSIPYQVAMEYLACKALEGKSRHTVYNYKMNIVGFLATINKQLDEITTSDIRMYLYDYQQRRKVSNRSLDKIRLQICTFFHWAAAEGKIERDPSLAIRPIKYVAAPRTSLTQIELEYVRKCCGDLRDHAIVEMLYSTGCRVSELAQIKVADINWKDNSVGIVGKGGKHRTVFLNAKAVVTVRDYLDRRKGDSEYLICAKRKPYGGLKPCGIQRIVSDISDRAFRLTGKRITPHIFRHTTATIAVQNGMPIQDVSKLLGHSQVETTMIYAEIDTQDIQREHRRYVV